MANTNIYDMTDTWNAGGTTFTSIKMNVTDTASAAGSLLLDLQVAAASKFSVSKTGAVVAAAGLTATTISGTTGTFSSTMSATGGTFASGSLSADANAVSITQTWNNSGVTFTGALKVNVTDTASNASSQLVSVQLGGTEIVRIGKTKSAVFSHVLEEGYISGHATNATAQAGTFRYYLANTGSTPFVCLGNLGVIGFDANATAGAPDTSIARNAAGVLEVNNGTRGTLRDIYVRNARLTQVAVASLVAASTAGKGALAYVTDATATTARSTVAGGGANEVLVMSNGTNWIIVA